jgi:hypothetical protein
MPRPPLSWLYFLRKFLSTWKKRPYQERFIPTCTDIADEGRGLQSLMSRIQVFDYGNVLLVLMSLNVGRDMKEAL